MADELNRLAEAEAAFQAALGKIKAVKRQQWVHEYLVDFNGAQAAVRVGYSATGCRQEAVRLLKNKAVREAVQAGMALLRERAGIQADALLAELDRLAMANLGDLLEPDPTTGQMRIKPFAALGRDQLATLSRIEQDTMGGGAVLSTKIWQHSKLRALEKALERRGLLANDNQDAHVTIHVVRGGD